MIDTPLHPLHLLTVQNMMNSGFTDTSLTRALQHRFLGDCVKTCNTVSTFSLSVEPRCLQSIACPHFSLFCQPQIYHATIQVLHLLVFKIHFSVFASHSHSLLPLAF
jgi:hypothetical protein